VHWVYCSEHADVIRRNFWVLKAGYLRGFVEGFLILCPVCADSYSAAGLAKSGRDSARLNGWKSAAKPAGFYRESAGDSSGFTSNSQRLENSFALGAVGQFVRTRRGRSMPG